MWRRVRGLVSIAVVCLCSGLLLLRAGWRLRCSFSRPSCLQLSEEVEGVRSSMEVDVPLACKLDVIAGPCTGRNYTNTEEVLEVGCCAPLVCYLAGA